MPYTARVVRAFEVAHRLHHSQTRKGSEVPYLTHLMAVAAIVGEFGGTEDQLIAALLHDAAEDQGGVATLNEIRSEFGPAVADLVDACTDTFEQRKPPWKERKLAYIERVGAIPEAARLIVAADKIHNLRSMCADYRAISERLWDRFTASREESLWYYTEMTEALEKGWTHPIVHELHRCLDELKSLTSSQA